MNTTLQSTESLNKPDLAAQGFAPLLQDESVKFDLSGSRKGKFISVGKEDRLIVDFLNWVFPYAAQVKASDVQFSDVENGCAVRLCQENDQFTRLGLFTRDAGEDIRRKICAMCSVEITNSESIQDGSFFIIDEERQKMIDIRVSVLPTKFGCSIVCRILDQSNSGRSLDSVNMPDDIHQSVLQILKQQQGMVIVSGPTGSGKTSTLYSFLNYLNTPDKHIMTAEDPVEYRLPGADQVNIHPYYRPFERVLKAFLRQKPHIILVGEIRDIETAATAVNAANTGHLLLSTIHANDALSTVIRLVNLGVERFALADALSAFFAQRLMNKLCPECRQEVRLNQEEQAAIKTRFPATTYYRRNQMGCDKCDYTGRSGRIPVMEFAVRTEEVRQGILTGDFERLRQAMLVQPQFRTLVEAGLQLSKQGLVDMQEALSLGVR